MAEPQVTPEIASQIAAGLVSEAFTTPPSLSGEVSRAVAVHKAGQSERALQMLAGEVCPYTKDDVRGVVLENLSSKERDSKTGQKKEPDPNTPEGKRYKETLDVAEAMRQYLESGGQNIPNELLPLVYDYLSKTPAFKDLIIDASGNVKTADAEAIARTILRQPEVRKAMLRLFTERLDPSKRLKGEEVVRQLQAELKVLEEQVIDVNQVNQEINKIKSDIQLTKTQITSDENYQEYLNLNSQLEDLNDELQILQETLKQARITNPQQLQQIVSDITQKRSEIRKIHSQLQDARFNNITSNLQRIQSLQTQLQALEGKRNQANTEEQKKLRLQLEQKKLELQETQLLLTAERIKWASEVIAIPSEAAKEYLDEALAETAKHYKEEAAKSAQEKEEEKKKREQEALRKIGERVGRKMKRIKVNGVTTDVPVPDKRTASELMALLMQPDGLSRFGQHILGEIYTIDNSTSPPTFIFKGNNNPYGLTEEEAEVIKGKLGDYQYLKTTGISLAKKVMAEYFLAGGRLSRDMVLALTNSDLGKSLIDDGLKLAEEQRKTLEGMVGKDVLTKFDEIKQGKSTGEWLRQNWWKFGLGIIAILLFLGLGIKGVPGIRG